MSENAINRDELHILINHSNENRIGLFDGYRFFHEWFDEPGDFDSAFRKIREYSDRRRIIVYLREEARTVQVLGDDGQLRLIIDLLVELRVGRLRIIRPKVEPSFNYQNVSNFPGTFVEQIAEKSVPFMICTQGLLIITDIINSLEDQAHILQHHQNDQIRINEKIQEELRKQMEWVAQERERRMNQSSEESDERQQEDDKDLQRSLPSFTK